MRPTEADLRIADDDNMQKKLVVGLVLLATLVGRLVSLAVILPPPVKTITLTWEYTANPDIVFNIYGTTNLALPVAQWPLVATVAETSCSIPAQAESCFFVVTASNIVTGLESTFNR